MPDVSLTWLGHGAFRFDTPGGEVRTSGVPLRDYFVYVYRGVNPFGQLREQKDYWFAGFGWTFGI